MGKNHAVCLEPLRDLWDESAWITMLDDQMAACRLESLADLLDCRMNKGNPTILARHLCSRAGQGGENRLIEYKHQLQTFRMFECSCKGGVVFQSKVSPKPDHRTGL